MSRLRQKGIATPTDLPNPGEFDFYIKPDGTPCTIDSNGVEVCYAQVSGQIHGSFFQKNENNVPANTSSTSFQNYLTLSFAGIDSSPTAIYKVSLFFVWGYSDGGKDFRAQLTINNIQYGEEFRKEPKDTGTNQRYW